MQNKCIRYIFFAHSMESPDPYYKLLDVLKLDNIFKLKIATFTHKILNNKECIPVIFLISFFLQQVYILIILDMQVIRIYTESMKEPTMGNSRLNIRQL